MTAAVLEILRAVARPGGDVSGIAALGDAELATLEALAGAHGLRPSLLAAFWTAGVSERTSESLNRWAHDHARRCLALTAELTRLVELFETARIAAVPFKGPLLAMNAYGDVAAREYVDLDVLVPRRHAERARDLLIDAGFTGGLDAKLDSTREARFVRINHQHPMISPSAHLVEIQWGLAPRHLRLRTNTDEMIARSLPITLGGSPVRSLAPEDVVIVTCVNGAKDAWSRLSMVSDLAHVMDRHPDLDWGSLFRRAREGHVARMVGVGVELVRRILDVSTWPGRALVLSDEEVRSMAYGFERLSLETAGPPAQPAEASGLDPRFRRLMDRSLDRWASPVLRVTTPTEEDWDWVDLPSWLDPAYYAIRPTRLAIKRLTTRR